ncbi:MAG: alpha/beta fold hydrolase [Rhodospirillales bacterium]
MMPPRPGPRPLPLHLATAAAICAGSRLAWPLLRSGWPSSSHDLAAEAASLRLALESAPAEAFDAAVDREARRRLDGFLTGLAAYLAHPYRRALADPAPAWTEGTTALRDYGPADGRPVLVVPSLVNRAYVLDLAPDMSLLRFLAGRGLRPLLVDWRAPGDDERLFTLSDYVAGRLERALERAVALAGGPVPVIGYCMGGLLALALALRRPQAVSALAFLATPWDFHAGTGGPPPALALMRSGLGAIIDATGTMPVDLMQTLFFSLDPTQSFAKFRRFATLDPASEAARAFVALEDWANDGVPLAAAVARECLDGWYLANTPAAGRWHVAGRPVRPQDWSGPALAVIPARDRIVPPASATALADALPACDRLNPPAGHVGMVVGGRADAALWRPLADWLRARG